MNGCGDNNIAEGIDLVCDLRFYVDLYNLTIRNALPEKETDQSLALTGGASLISVTAAALKAGAPVSLTFVAVLQKDRASAFQSRSKIPKSQRPTEDDLVALLPHLCHQRLAGNDGPGESDLDIRVRAECLQDVFTGNTHEAETVQD